MQSLESAFAAGREMFSAGVVATAGAFMLLLLWLLWPRKKKERRRTKDHPQTIATHLAADLNKPGRGDWVKPGGAPATAAPSDGTYRVKANIGVRSTRSLATGSGEKFCLVFEVAAISDPTNGGPANFFVGPMFLDADGKVVGWWREQPPISVAQGVRRGAVEAVAPAGAATAHISICGSFMKEGPPGNGEIAFSRLHLTRVS